MTYYLTYSYEREVRGTQIIGDIEYKLPKRIESIECEESFSTLEEVIKRYEEIERKYEIQEMEIVCVDDETDETEILDWIQTNEPMPKKWEEELNKC
jgi:hypothetical protein